jgi:hypothetical protein
MFRVFDSFELVIVELEIATRHFDFTMKVRIRVIVILTRLVFVETKMCCSRYLPKDGYTF